MVSILGKFEKQPTEVLTYKVSYEQWFSNRVDAPLSFTVTAVGLTVVAAERVGQIIYVTLSGGVRGAVYDVSVLLTTTATPANTKEANFRVKIKDL